MKQRLIFLIIFFQMSFSLKLCVNNEERIILKNLMILFIMNGEKYFVIFSITEVFSVHVHVYQLLVSEKGAIVIMILW